MRYEARGTEREIVPEKIELASAARSICVSPYATVPLVSACRACAPNGSVHTEEFTDILWEICCVQHDV